jgi:hypothetical protein
LKAALEAHSGQKDKGAERLEENRRLKEQLESLKQVLEGRIYENQQAVSEVIQATEAKDKLARQQQTIAVLEQRLQKELERVESLQAELLALKARKDWL